MKLEMVLFCPHGQTQERVSGPCVTHGLVHRLVVRTCVPCAFTSRNKMLRTEHTNRDMGMCLNVCATQPRTRACVLAM